VSELAESCWILFVLEADIVFWLVVLHLIGVL